MQSSSIDWDIKYQLNLQVFFKDLSRVKSGIFVHQVNSDTHLQTVEIQMRRLFAVSSGFSLFA